MTTQELKARYDEIYERLRTSKDVGNMRLFGAGVTKMFEQVAATSPNIAMMALEYWAALWLTVNMIYSDFANAFVAITGKKDNDTIATASYTFAVKKLKDRDRPHFIREYFELE